MIESFTATCGGGGTSTDGVLRVCTKSDVTLRWSVRGEVRALRLNGEELDASSREKRLVAEDDRSFALVAEGEGGQAIATLFLDVTEKGEVVSPHAVLSAAGAEGAAGGAATGLSGAFTSGGEPLAGARFLLHRDSEDGPLITPDTFPSDRSTNQFIAGAWVADEEGRYSFAGMPPGRYYVDLVELGESDVPPDPSAIVEPDWDDDPEGPEGLVWVQLFDDSGLDALEETEYELDVGGATIRGRTDGDGLLRHPSLPTGHFTLRAAGGVGTVPSLPESAAERPFAVRVRGAGVRG